MSKTVAEGAGRPLRPIPVSPAGDWECPCGREKPRKGSSLTPVQTIVSLREPYCRFCGCKQREEYRRAPLAIHGSRQVAGGAR